MFVTDKSYTKQEFKDKLIQLGNELSNRTGQRVKIQPNYEMGVLKAHDIIIDVYNIWSVSFNETNGRVGMIRVFVQ